MTTLFGRVQEVSRGVLPGVSKGLRSHHDPVQVHAEWKVSDCRPARTLFDALSLGPSAEKAEVRRTGL